MTDIKEKVHNTTLHLQGLFRCAQLLHMEGGGNGGESLNNIRTQTYLNKLHTKRVNFYADFMYDNIIIIFKKVLLKDERFVQFFASI